jgi:hypothetical protein
MRVDDYMVVANVGGVLRVIGCRAMDAGERSAVHFMLLRRFGDGTNPLVPPPVPTTEVQKAAAPPVVPTTALQKPSPQTNPTLTQGEIAREMGFTGNPCPACGGMKMKFAGKCETCSECGHSAGCS